MDADDLHAELIAIDENLCRAELSPAERAKQTARRKTIYEEIHPETRHGAIGNGREKSGQVVHSTFADATAEAIGKDARTVRRDAERGEKISDRALGMVAGTALDTGAYLDKLKKLGLREQEAQVQRELAEVRKPVSPAPAVIGSRPRPVSDGMISTWCSPTATMMTSGYGRSLKISTVRN